MSRRALAVAGASAVAAAAAAAWWYTDSAPYPYAQRRLLDLPLPFLTNRRLDALLGIRPGERVLEIGPGTGLQALHVAGLLGSEGRLDIIDVQDVMLEHVMRRARAAGITSITAAKADARQLPFPAATFDAAYLVTVLGEIPDPAAACASCGASSSQPGDSLSVSSLTATTCPSWTSSGTATRPGLSSPPARPAPRLPSPPAARLPADPVNPPPASPIYRPRAALQHPVA